MNEKTTHRRFHFFHVVEALGFPPSHLNKKSKEEINTNLITCNRQEKTEAGGKMMNES